MKLGVIWPFSYAANQTWFGPHSTQSLTRASVWSFLSANSQSLFQIISGVALARMLVPEDYGKISLVTVIYNVLSQINSFSLSNAVVQKPDLSARQGSSLFWVIVALSTVFAIVLVGLGLVLSYAYEDWDYLSLAIIFALLIILDGSGSVHNALIRRAMRFDFQFWSIVWISPISILSAIWLAGMGAGCYSVAMMSVVGGVLARLLLFRFIQWTPGKFERGTGIGGMIRFGGFSTLAMAVDFVYQQSQVFFLGKFSGVAEVGIYNRGQTLFQRPFGQIMGPMLQVFLPALASVQHDADAVVKFVRRTTWLLSVALIPLALWVFFFGESAAVLVLGEPWREAGRAMGAFAIGTVPWIFTASLISSMTARGWPARGLEVRLLMMPFFLYYTFIAAENGAVAVANVSAIFNWLGLVPTIFVITRRLRPSFVEMLGLLFNICICSAIVAIVLYWLNIIGQNILFSLWALFLAYFTMLIVSSMSRTMREWYSALFSRVRKAAAHLI